MKGWISFFVIVALILTGTFILKSRELKLADPGGEVIVKEKSYDKYAFENLADRGGIPSTIEIGRTLGEEESFTSYIFYYTSESRRISGQLNLPTGTVPEGVRPVMVMARGYVEKEQYQAGIGTKNAAAVYAKNGYITLAPDFSGFGESDAEDPNALGARLIKPVEILDLIASLSSLPQVDLSRVYLWGHSNGGQIMLSVAEILGMRDDLQGLTLKGMALWAPVTKPFPYNILYYTDEADDQGKWLRHEIAKFEADYDVYKYSIDKYYAQIKLPIQIHQGTNDEAVPKKWSDGAVAKWKELGKEVNYYVYPGADHDMRPNWNQVVARDLEFFAGL